MKTFLIILLIHLAFYDSKFLIMKSNEILTPNNLDDTYGTNMQKEVVN
jgi:hypothetical protein